jgi:hypothetical protein
MLDFADRYDRSGKIESVSKHKRRLEEVLRIEQERLGYAEAGWELQTKTAALEITQQLIRNT